MEREIKRVTKLLKFGITGQEKEDSQTLQAWQLMSESLRKGHEAFIIHDCNASKSAFLIAFRRLFGVDYRALFPEKDVTVAPTGENGLNRG